MERRDHLCSVFQAEALAQVQDAWLDLFVYDLSHDGCTAATGDPRLVAGAAVTLHLATGAMLRGRVLWREKRHAGIGFSPRLSVATLAVLLRSAPGASDPPAPTPEVRHGGRKPDPPHFS